MFQSQCLPRPAPPPREPPPPLWPPPNPEEWPPPKDERDEPPPKDEREEEWLEPEEKPLGQPELRGGEGRKPEPWYTVRVGR